MRTDPACEGLGPSSDRAAPAGDALGFLPSRRLEPSTRLELEGRRIADVGSWGRQAATGPAGRRCRTEVKTMMWGGGWWVMGVIVMLACMYFMARMMMGHGDHGDHGDGTSNRSARDILAERFARGEISGRSSRNGSACLSTELRKHRLGRGPQKVSTSCSWPGWRARGRAPLVSRLRRPWRSSSDATGDPSGGSRPQRRDEPRPAIGASGRPHGPRR